MFWYIGMMPTLYRCGQYVLLCSSKYSMRVLRCENIRGFGEHLIKTVTVSPFSSLEIIQRSSFTEIASIMR